MRRLLKGFSIQMEMKNKNLIEGLESLCVTYSDVELTNIWAFYRYLVRRNSSVNLMSRKDLEHWETFVDMLINKLSRGF